MSKFISYQHVHEFQNVKPCGKINAHYIIISYQYNSSEVFPVPLFFAFEYRFIHICIIKQRKYSHVGYIQRYYYLRNNTFEHRSRHSPGSGPCGSYTHNKIYCVLVHCILFCTLLLQGINRYATRNSTD